MSKNFYRNAMIVASMLFISTAGSVFAVEPSGAREYWDNCARCHGSDAKGNGPDSDENPGSRPADLTHIARRNGGKFPRQVIYDVIDGGQLVPGHYNLNSTMPL
jgi:mono/diheme cytochrome c family protein